jgi:hypothetical protein
VLADLVRDASANASGGASHDCDLTFQTHVNHCIGASGGRIGKISNGDGVRLSCKEVGPRPPLDHFCRTETAYKLGVRFQADDMVKRFLASGRTGFYLAVGQEGDVGAGDPIILVARDPHAVGVSEITRLYVTKAYSRDDAAAVRTALQVAALPESWKEHFRDRLGSMTK